MGSPCALTSCRLQLRDVLGAFVVRVLSGHHLVPLAALLVQHVWDLQGSFSLCSQVQVLLSKVGPQLPDFKLEEKTTHKPCLSCEQSQKLKCYSWGPVPIPEHCRSGKTHSGAEPGHESKLVLLSQSPGEPDHCSHF